MGTNFQWSRMSGGLKRVQKALEAIDSAWATTVADGSITSAKIADGAIVNADVNASAAIAWSKMASLTSAYMLVGNGSNVPTAVAISGDISMGNDGVAAIASGVIVNADVNASAAIAYSKLTLTGSVVNADVNASAAIDYSKLAALTSAYILVGNGSNVCTAVAMSGDAAIDNAGAVTVSDLTIASEAQGDILYRGASSWLRLAAGTAGQALVTSGAGSNPYWGEPSVALASKLTGSFVMEGGTYDITHSVTTQTSSAPTLTIPDFAGVSDTYTFNTLAATLANKTLTAPKIVTTGYIADAGGDEYLKFVEATTPVTYVQITSGDTGVAPRVQGAGETNTDLLLIGNGTGNVYIADAADTTKDVNFELNGATTAKTTTLVFSQSDDRSITFPDSTGTLATIDVAETFTNKTLTSPILTTPKIDDGHEHCTITSANQTNASATITIPDCGDAADEFVLKDTTQTLTGKTLTSPTLTTPRIVSGGYIADGNGDELLMFTAGATPVNYLTISSTPTGYPPQLSATGSDTNISLYMKAKGSGKVTVTDSTDTTKRLHYDCSGMTNNSNTTLTFVQTVNRTVTYPDATCTLVGKDTTDVFTNKSFDCDGSGNALTNVNANELDPVTPAASAIYGVDFTFAYVLTNQAAAVNIYDTAAPFKFRIIDAWSVSTSADGGTWKLNNGALGAGTDITDVVTVAASDKDIDRITEIDDAAHEIASGGSLSVVPDAGGALDCIIYIKCLRVD